MAILVPIYVENTVISPFYGMYGGMECSGYTNLQAA
jgi:hypothetical protein